MASLLHLDASARHRSFSREVGRAFADEWRKSHPGGSYVHRDLAAAPIPLIDEARTEIAERVSAKGVRNIARIDEVLGTPAQAASWSIARPLLEELLGADTLLVATPMYNFSVPASLKAWIDQVTFPWISLANTSVVVVTGRGGSYAPGTPREHDDFQEPFLRAYFTRLGVSDLTFVHTELTNAEVLPFLSEFREQHRVSRDAALQIARALARRGDGALP